MGFCVAALVRFAPLPDGRSWGSTAGVTVAADGTIWAYDRCGANSCAGSSLDPIIAFAPDGKVLRHFGGGLFQMPHGLIVDDAGNAWVTDNAAKDGRGRQVYKFSPDGKILMTLGKARGGEAPEGLFQPNAIAIASIPNPRPATPRPTPTIPIVKRASVSAGWRMPGYWD